MMVTALQGVNLRAPHTELELAQTFLCRLIDYTDGAGVGAGADAICFVCGEKSAPAPVPAPCSEGFTYVVCSQRRVWY